MYHKYISILNYEHFRGSTAHYRLGQLTISSQQICKSAMYRSLVSIHFALWQQNWSVSLILDGNYYHEPPPNAVEQLRLDNGLFDLLKSFNHLLKTSYGSQVAEVVGSIIRPRYYILNPCWWLANCMCV